MKATKILTAIILSAALLLVYGCPSSTGNMAANQNEQTCYQLVDQQKYEDAIYYCNAALRDHKSENLYLVAGYANILGGRPADGILLLNEGVEKYPRSQMLRESLVVALIAIKEYDLAEPHVVELLNQDPKNGAYYYYGGEVLYGQGKYSDAVGYFKQAVSYAPPCNGEWDEYQCGHAYYEMGQAYTAMGDADNATNAYEMATKINPNSDKFDKAYTDVLLDSIFKN